MDMHKFAIISKSHGGKSVRLVIERDGQFYVPTICIEDLLDSNMLKMLIQIKLELDESETHYIGVLSRIFGEETNIVQTDAIELGMLGLAVNNVPNVVSLKELKGLRGENLHLAFRGRFAPLESPEPLTTKVAEAKKHLADGHLIISKEDRTDLDKFLRIITVNGKNMVGYSLRRKEELIGITLESFNIWQGRHVDVDCFFDLDIPLYRLSNRQINLVNAVCAKYNFVKELNNTTILSLNDIMDKYGEITDYIDSLGRGA